MSETRKLAAILVSDVVGYSRLAGTDEEATTSSDYFGEGRSVTMTAKLAVLFAALANLAGASFAWAEDAAPAKLPNVVILCTGGTIAGSGATTTTTVGYTAGKIGCDTLVDSVPEIEESRECARRTGLSDSEREHHQ
jgi:hypothetical protein